MGKNGGKDDIVKLAGREFNIVKKGLDEAQVAAYIKELASERDELLQREEHLQSLTKLAERTVIEADRLTEDIKKGAIEKAMSDAADEVDKLLEETKKEALKQARGEIEVIKAKAEGQTRQIYDRLLSQLEGVRQQVEALREGSELEAPSTDPEVSLEGAGDQDTESEDLIQILNLTNKSELEEETPVSADKEVPVTYGEEIEETLPRGNEVNMDDKFNLPFPPNKPNLAH